MAFASFSDLIAMSGHGKYVWSVVLISTLFLLALFWRAIKKYKKQKRIYTQLQTLK